MSVKPISPSEIADLKVIIFPDEVIQCWNEIIALKYNNGSAKVEQDTVISVLMTMLNADRNQIFSNGWLEIEDIYRKQGWKVEYHKPDYTEAWKAYFVFTK